MALNVTLEIPGATQEDLKNLSNKLPKAGKLSLKPMKDGLMFWKLKGFEILGVVEGLKEQPTSKSENWLLTPETSKALTELLTEFRKVSPRIFHLYASEGELPRRESDLQFAELVEALQEGRLGNRVTYRVRDLPPKIEMPVEEPQQS